MVGRPPQITSISPKIGFPGDAIVITGKYFGDVRGSSEVIISGYAPVSSGYLEWTATRISLRVPNDTSSGLVHVMTRNGKSNGIFFTNRQDIPTVLSGPGKPGEPYISGLSVKNGPIGTLLTISGMNFGLQKGASQVLFTWISGEERRADPLVANSLIPAQEYDQDYEVWSDREIEVRVPDGAGSGHIRVMTDKGESNAAYFEVESAVGTKLYPAKRTYSVRYSVTVRDISAKDPNGLYVFLPQILEGPEQRSIQLVAQEPEPLFHQVQGIKLFYLQNLQPDKSYRIVQEFMFDRYSVETRVNPARVSGNYEAVAKLAKKFTVPEPQIPADNARIKELGRAIVGGEKNPFLRARLLYNWVLARLSPLEESQESDILRAVESRSGDSRLYAFLFSALCRSLQVPARPVSGFLIGWDLKAEPHTWAEFYIPEVGWIPVDPYLGEGKGKVSLAADINPGTYYFGGLDSSHICLSRGFATLTPMDPEGRSLQRKDVSSLQNIHEEATGNLFGYVTQWSGLEVLGVY